MAGCGTPGPKLYKAGGTVTYKDKPVEGATVTFVYADSNFASGRTDAAGKYQLTYMAKSGGAALGKCSATVTKVESRAEGVPPPPETKDPLQRAKDMQKYEDAVKKKLEAEKAGAAVAVLLPAKYGDPKTSNLTFEITADEAKNDFPIVLTD